MNKGVSLIALTITIIVVIIMAGITYEATTNQNEYYKNRKIEAIINGTIKCEVDYYREYSSGTAKIVAKDGTIYYTSDYIIIENGE